MNATVDDTSPFGAYEPNSVQRRLYRFMAGLYGYGWIGKRIFGRLRWLDRLVASGEIADVERFGLRWRLYRRGNVSDSRLLLRPGSFDPVETDMLLRRVRPGFAFFDVGAKSAPIAASTRSGSRRPAAGSSPSNRIRRCSAACSSTSR